MSPASGGTKRSYVLVWISLPVFQFSFISTSSVISVIVPNETAKYSHELCAGMQTIACKVMSDAAAGI